MGFTPKGKVYVLDFEGDPELDGLEVKCRSAPISAMLAMGELLESATSIEGGDPNDPAVAVRQLQAMRPLLAAYADVLVEWNLELDPGTPVPATFEGLCRLDAGQVMRIIAAWQKAVSDVPAPLPEPSSSGAPSLAASLPMEPLSPSLAS